MVQQEGIMLNGIREHRTATGGVLVCGLCGFGLALSVVACGSGATEAEDPPDHVTAVVLPFLSVVPFHIAAEEGYFVEQNLDVEFIRLNRDQDIMTVLARGDADVASGMMTATELGLAALWQRVDRFVPGYVFSMVKYGPTLIEDRPEVGERFAVAMLQAVRQLNLGKTPRNLALVERPV